MEESEIDRIAEQIVAKIRNDVESMAKVIVLDFLSTILEQIDRLEIALDALEDEVYRSKPKTDNIPKLEEAI